jgi:hypothetical protein
MDKNAQNNFDLLGALDAIRGKRCTFSAGIEAIQQIATDVGGNVTTDIEDGQQFYTIEVGNQKAVCYQPYPDIDRFYFEM